MSTPTPTPTLKKYLITIRTPRLYPLWPDRVHEIKTLDLEDTMQWYERHGLVVVHTQEVGAK